MKKITILRTIFVCSFLLVAMLVYEISSNYSVSQKLVKTNATPITNKTIVLDAGHGLPDEGAVGFTGTTEQAINLEIVLKLQKLIEQSGAKVYITRSDEMVFILQMQTQLEKKR